MKNSKKLVIAYSGGLDTSYCAVSLSKAGYEVHAVSVNTGGFTESDVQTIEQNAYKMGVSTYKNIEAVTTFYQKVVKFLIFGNVLKNNTYPLSVSAERIVQAIEIIEYAKSIGAEYIAHGSTGAGNDQVRFDMIFQTLAPEIEIITPIRDQKLSRQEEIAYLKLNGIDLDWEKAKYSVNKGLWGTSVGGDETLTSHLALPEAAYPSQLESVTSETVTLTFKKGELMSLIKVKKGHHGYFFIAPFVIGIRMNGWVVGLPVIGSVPVFKAIHHQKVHYHRLPVVPCKELRICHRHAFVQWNQCILANLVFSCNPNPKV